MAQIDVSGFNVPETPLRDEGASARLSQNMWRNKEWQYRMQKEQEADDWKKMNMIQDLTDLSKHQTPSDVANAIGNQQAASVLQKYTAAAKNMSFADLQGNISKDMSGVMNGMDGTKNELQAREEQAKQIKALHPEVDLGQLTQTIRADILHRRLKNDSEFTPPAEIQQSQLQLDNPEYLANFVPKVNGIADTKILNDEIRNPKGAEPKEAAVGDSYNNTVFGGKLPTWMKMNFTPEQAKGGFLPHGFTPKMEIKAEPLPTDFLPALQGTQRYIVSPEVEQEFMSQHPLSVIAGTKSMFGDKYNEMSEGEKSIARRDYLYGKIKSLDQSGFTYKSSTHPSAAQNKIFLGDSGKGAAAAPTINDVYGQIDKDLGDWEKQGSSSMMPLQNLSQDAKDVLIPKLQQNQKALDDGGAVNTEDLRVVRGNDGGIRVFKSDGDYVMDIGKKNTNLKAQPSVKEKREVIKQGEAESNYSIKGKTYTHQQLLDMGYTPEQIAPYKK